MCRAPGFWGFRAAPHHSIEHYEARRFCRTPSRIDNNHRERHGDVKKNCAEKPKPDLSTVFFVMVGAQGPFYRGFGECQHRNSPQFATPVHWASLFLSTRKRTARFPPAPARCAPRVKLTTDAALFGRIPPPSIGSASGSEIQATPLLATATASFCSPEASTRPCSPGPCLPIADPVRPPEPAPQPVHDQTG